jgi:hypothetical protein
MSGWWHIRQQPSPRDPDKVRIARRLRDDLDDLDDLLGESRRAGERFTREMAEMQHRLEHLAEALPDEGGPS